MRIWDINPALLCRKHLLGEHRELHALWTIITKQKKGYSHHPETLRWVGKLPALYTRHQLLVVEMKNRNYKHHSPLEKKGITGSAIQDSFIDTIPQQLELLGKKGCECLV